MNSILAWVDGLPEKEDHLFEEGLTEIAFKGTPLDTDSKRFQESSDTVESLVVGNVVVDKKEQVVSRQRQPLNGV